MSIGKTLKFLKEVLMNVEDAEAAKTNFSAVTDKAIDKVISRAFEAVVFKEDLINN
jgi:hypothetical protein